MFQEADQRHCFKRQINRSHPRLIHLQPMFELVDPRPHYQFATYASCVTLMLILQTHIGLLRSGSDRGQPSPTKPHNSPAMNLPSNKMLDKIIFGYMAVPAASFQMMHYSVMIDEITRLPKEEIHHKCKLTKLHTKIYKGNFFSFQS